MPRLRLVSLAGIKFDDDVYEVLLPTMDGEIGVMQDHMPLITVAINGAIAVRHNAQDSDEYLDFFAISGGVVAVEGNVVRVLTDEADLADNIDEAEARAANERARKMKAEATDSVSIEHAQELIDRTAVRLQVAGLKRRVRH